MHFFARKWDLVKRRLPFHDRRLDRAAGKHSSYTRLFESVDCRVRHLGIAHDVAPVEERGHPVVDLVQRPEQVADADVLGAVTHCQVPMHVAVVIALAHPVGADAAERIFPGMDVRVDQSRGDDHVPGINNLRGARADVFSHFHDLAVVNEDVATVDDPDLGIHRDDGGVLDQLPRHDSLRYSKCGHGRGPRPCKKITMDCRRDCAGGKAHAPGRCLRMTPSIAFNSASTVIGFALCAMATSGSFRPCPVRVHTMVLPSPTFPSSRSFSKPASAMAEAGSQKMPSVWASS